MNVKKLAWTALAIGLVGLASITVGPRESHAGKGAVEVIVTNSDTQPVPVNAAVWNDEKVPLHVYGIEKRERIGAKNLAYSWTSTGVSEQEIYQAPADRNVMIESVSCRISPIFAQAARAYVTFTTPDTAAHFMLEANVPVNRLQGTQPVQISLRPGEKLGLFASAEDATGLLVGGQAFCSFSGYATP